MDNQPVGVSALDMSHIRVRSTRLAYEQEIIIEIESTLATAVCRCCGRTISEFACYDEPRRLPYMPTTGGVTRIYFYPKRFRCQYCADHPITVEQFSWLLHRSVGK
jgi:transposase